MSHAKRNKREWIIRDKPQKRLWAVEWRPGRVVYVLDYKREAAAKG